MFQIGNVSRTSVCSWTKVPDRELFYCLVGCLGFIFPIRNMETGMTAFGEDEARAFGQRQEDVVLATGVGRRYLIELEAGKPTARLGPALMIARQLGISFHPFDQSQADQSHSGIDDLGLPPLADLPPLKD